MKEKNKNDTVSVPDYCRITDTYDPGVPGR